ncbi:MAG: AAA family ATPase [Rhodocyclales bacterium]|nr:AAA family ATPase [Rhodocyclales bacterium]
MYLEHFGLNEPPFRITPHTDFFFDGANRGATLDALVYAITHDEGIVKVSGEVGSGKTMLCRVLMERLPQNVTIIYLANPSLSRDDILFAIADELGLSIAENARTSAVMRALQDHLIASFGEGRQVVVLIDEAHAMPAETLEEIRLLSNLETNRHKLLQLVLFGQPELNDVLARPDMRQLKERITHNFGLAPLLRDDISQYLDFRMRAAGYRGPSIFMPPALKMIERSSLGLTRRINILADKALLAAFSSGSHQIGPKEVQAAIRDSEFSEAAYGGKMVRNTKTIWIATALAIGAAAAIFWLLSAQTGNNPTTVAPSSTDIPSPPAAVTPAPPAGTTPPPTQGSPASNPSPATAEASTPGPSAGAPQVAANPPARVALTTPASQSAVPISAPPTPSPTVAGTAPTGRTTQAPATMPKVGPLTGERLEAGRAWLEQVPNDHWFVQVYDTDARRHGEIEALLLRVQRENNELGNVYVYFSELSGAPRFGVTYGSYATGAAAAMALRNLPKSLKASKPYPRQVLRLR